MFPNTRDSWEQSSRLISRVLNRHAAQSPPTPPSLFLCFSHPYPHSLPLFISLLRARARARVHYRFSQPRECNRRALSLRFFLRLHGLARSLSLSFAFRARHSLPFERTRHTYFTINLPISRFRYTYSIQPRRLPVIHSFIHLTLCPRARKHVVVTPDKVIARPACRIFLPFSSTSGSPIYILSFFFVFLFFCLSLYQYLVSLLVILDPVTPTSPLDLPPFVDRRTSSNLQRVDVAPSSSSSSLQRSRHQHAV